MRALLLPSLLALACSATPGSPCPDVGCGAFAHCAPDGCACDDGFASSATGCVSSSGAADEPSKRTADDVCARWRTGHAATTTGSGFTAGATSCAPGTLATSAIADTLTRLNLYRWLAGLGPVGDKAELDAQAQQCAVLTAANAPSATSHTPPPSAACYSVEGAKAAGESNLAWGPGSAANAIDLFVDDTGNFATMGHRRWVLNPPLGPVGVGYAVGTRDPQMPDAECLMVFRREGTGPAPRFYSWPGAGPQPKQAFLAPFTFHGASVDPAKLTASVVRVRDGAVLASTVSALPDGYADRAALLTPNGWSASVGETYRVTVSPGAGPTVTFETSPADCD